MSRDAAMTSPVGVSVLLPVRDAEATLALALASVARQSRVDFECVVVDDGSRDASPEIAERFARRDPRFRVLRRPARGIVAALTTGLAACRGSHVARMDADDWMHRHRIARQCAALDAAPGLAGVGCHVRVFPRRDLTPGLRRYEHWLRGIRDDRDVAREAWVECPLPHPTWLFRREALAAHAYREVEGPEDYDVLLRLIRGGRRIGVVPERLHAWRDAPGRMWRTSVRYAQERIVACKAEHLAAGALEASPHYLLWGYGATGRALARALRAHGKRPSHVLELHPGRLGQRIQGAPVVRPETLPRLPRLPLVVSVSGAPARTEIRALLARMALREGVDFVCAA